MKSCFPAGLALDIRVIAHNFRYVHVPSAMLLCVALEYKTAKECWNILKSEIDCIVEKCVPLKKQGKRSKKKHLSKEAIRKIKYKQMMWKTYRHNGSEEDYANYKEALNQATAEIRNSKRS